MPIKKIGILREGKVPPDKRVAMNPSQCHEFTKKFPEIELVIQPSPIRCFPDQEYEKQGLRLQEDLSDCDLLIGVKEVNAFDLIAQKTFMFFSHTYKKQPYNRDLLKSILEKNISLIDYEVMTNPKGIRVIGFGRYAGVVGAYNGFRAWGEKFSTYNLRPAHACYDRKEMEGEYSKVKLPKNFKLVITGAGRVAKGATEVIEALGLKKVGPEDFLNKDFEGPVYTQLLVSDYYALDSGEEMNRHEFYKDPSGSHSIFYKYAAVADAYFPCHFWDNRAPYIFTREDAKRQDWNIKLVSDISCDIDSAIASTLRPSTIADPFYGYHPEREEEVDFKNPEAIGVVAVDNLPCELPRDASTDFGQEILENVMPYLLGEDDGRIEGARETNLKGELTDKYKYLEDWINE